MSQPNSASRFNPKYHIMMINGKPYLPVAACLVWLRGEHPDAEIETQLIKLEVLDSGIERAIFKAVIRLPTGGLATAYGSETSNDFREHIEKAEQKSVGRALRALGYGTAFAPDYADTFDAPREDTPTLRGAPPKLGQITSGGPPPVVAEDHPEAHLPATPRQIAYLQAMARSAGMKMEKELNDALVDAIGTPISGLTQRECTLYAEKLRHENEAARIVGIQG